MANNTGACMETNVANQSIGLERINNSQVPEHAFFSTVHINLLEQFLEFCKSKQANKTHQRSDHSLSKEKLYDQPLVDNQEFRTKLLVSYAEYLPSEVIDKLCLLVRQSCSAKCKYCRVPSENLVLSVLQILLDSVSKKSKDDLHGNDISENKYCKLSDNDDNSNVSKYKSEEGRGIPSTSAPTLSKMNVANEHKSDSPVASTCTPTVLVSSSDEGSHEECSHAAKPVRDHDIESVPTKPLSLPKEIPYKDTEKLYDGKETSDSFTRNPYRDVVSILDTPVVMAQKSSKINGSALHPEPVQNMKKKCRPKRTSSQVCPPRSKLFDDNPIENAESSKSLRGPQHNPLDDVMAVRERHTTHSGNPSKKQKPSINEHYLKPLTLSSPEIEILGERGFKDRCFELGKVTDQFYNKKNILTPITRSNISSGPPAHIAGPSRFTITNVEKRYYDVICGLAHSQWNCRPAVKFVCNTSVTFSSLGESVEPDGHVDNFFIAGYCRMLFEDRHPKRSKKHYFYPKVGGCLMTYSSQYDITVVKNSFLGANSAYKLHLSEKLCFPICEGNHWFVFIVDLRNSLFVFLDSYFGENDSYQIRARNNLLTSFKECWYEHADAKLDLEVFTVKYPPVPKQTNPHDCGIFAVKFMELWDDKIDLRQFFDHSHIPNIRVKLGNSLFFTEKNTVDKALVRNFFEQGIDPQLCK